VEKVSEAGAVVGGGHSIDHDIPLYGLAVTGLAEESKITRNAGAKAGDALVLTKPLGVGVTVSAGRADALAEQGAGRFFRKRLLAEGELDEAIRVMTALNRPAAEAMDGLDIHAATDVTGYGLLGHAHEMMDASGTTGEFAVGAIPLLAARFDPVAGVFALEKQGASSISALDEDFTWQAEGRTVGIANKLNKEVIIQAPFWLPDEWKLALHRREAPLFLNQGYPLTLDEEFQFVLPLGAQPARLPGVQESNNAPLRWRPPHLRAILIAASLASAPELQRKTRDGNDSSTSLRASSTWGSV